MRRVPKPDSVLFTPVRLGAFNLAHRVVMAAVRSCLAGPDGVPRAPATAHYRERATFGGLMISEPMHVLPDFHADRNCPGLYSTDQVNGWRDVANAVHRQGGILLAHLSLPTPDPPDTVSLDRSMQAFRNAVENAGDAGFDGTEIGAGPGTLVGALLRGECKAEPDYGGSLENRFRFLSEVLETVCGVHGADRVGLWLPPLQPEDLTGALALLRDQAIAYLHLPAWPSEEPATGATSADWRGVRSACGSTALMVSDSPLDALPTTVMHAGTIDAVSQGAAFLANPDLPRRLLQGLPLRFVGSAP